jgi:hypothetical protein
MESHGSLPHSQVPATCPYTEPVKSCPCPTSHFLKIHLNIFPSTPGSPQWSLSLRFHHQNPVHASHLPIRATCPAHLILLDFYHLHYSVWAVPTMQLTRVTMWAVPTMQLTLLAISRKILLGMRNVSIEIHRESQNTISRSLTFFTKILSFIVWKRRKIRRCLHCNNGYANAPHRYVIRTWPVL